ncbi:lanthionine synthetase LanC family protein [Actinomadura alba]|uniref:lanthionine synthetase LanC family protein n=1 Tax=Actinomadura alba TaxID=406431 RepID=UPI0028B1CC8A|nr:lanthionine synthetase LanC family protein [Actinomadura alba]
MYLLQRQSNCGDLLRDVLTYLVRLTKPLKADGDVLPGWWSDDGPELRPSPISPGGHGNFGMAHGIAGPLALLSTCMRRGITVPGQADAIDRICSWMDQWRSGTGSRAWWPEVISRAEWRDGTTRETGPGRPSWCYGTPGTGPGGRNPDHGSTRRLPARTMDFQLAPLPVERRCPNLASRTDLIPSDRCVGSPAVAQGPEDAETTQPGPPPRLRNDLRGERVTFTSPGTSPGTSLTDDFSPMR